MFYILNGLIPFLLVNLFTKNNIFFKWKMVGLQLCYICLSCPRTLHNVYFESNHYMGHNNNYFPNLTSDSDMTLLGRILKRKKTRLFIGNKQEN